MYGSRERIDTMETKGSDKCTKLWAQRLKAHLIVYCTVFAASGISTFATKARSPNTSTPVHCIYHSEMISPLLFPLISYFPY